jgi:AcrR family transcriptional regulator
MTQRSTPAPVSTTGLRRQPRQARSQERVRRILEAAEALFVAEGVASTTTNAIAAHAGVPIGSLYQFFPDKAAILRSLARGYGEQLHRELAAFEASEASALPLDAYIEAMVSLTDRFFTSHPGYQAIFNEAQSATADLLAIEEEADLRLVADWSEALIARVGAEGCVLSEDDARTMAYVLVKTVGNLLWLSLAKAPPFRAQLLQETVQLAVAYLRRRITLSSGQGQAASG